MPGTALIDTHGRPLVAASSEAAHRAGDGFSHELSRWLPFLGSADSDWLPDRDLTVSRTRDLIRNNGYASAAITKHLDNVIGTGLRLSARPDWQALGLDPEWAAEFARRAEALYRSWADDPGFYCDAARRQTFAGLQGMAYRSWIESGEALALLNWLPARGGPFATAVQMVDPDRLSNPFDLPDEPQRRRGVEIDEFGAPLAYHIRRAHPGEIQFAGPRLFEWVRVPRETPFGRPLVIHFFDVERDGQTRGKPLITPIVKAFKKLDRYTDAELGAAILNAIFTAYLETQMDPEFAGEMLGAQQGVGPYQEARSAFYENRSITLEGNRIATIFPGDRLQFLKSERPNAAYPAFVESSLRHMAAAAGLTYEQISQDWSKTNYSSARAALNEVWKGLNRRREVVGTYFAKPIYAALLEEWIDRGDIELPASAPAFHAARAAYCRCRWIGPGRGYVDPEKEAKGAVTRLQAGLSTLEDECAEQGKDWEEVIVQRAREIERMREMGVPVPAWADVAAMNGGPAPAPAATNQPE